MPDFSSDVDVDVISALTPCGAFQMLIYILFYSITSNHSRHFFATFFASHIFNHPACIYQTATR